MVIAGILGPVFITACFLMIPEGSFSVPPFCTVQGKIMSPVYMLVFGEGSFLGFAAFGVSFAASFIANALVLGPILFVGYLLLRKISKSKGV